MASQWVGLGEQGCVQPLPVRLHRRSHSGDAAANNENIVFGHSTFLWNNLQGNRRP